MDAPTVVALLVRFGGASAGAQAEQLVPVLESLGLTDVRVVADDEALWQAQRDGQRSPDGVVLKVSGQPGDLSRVIGAARDVGASVVSRAGLGLSWLRCAPADVPGLRSTLAPLALCGHRRRAAASTRSGRRSRRAWPR